MFLMPKWLQKYAISCAEASKVLSENGDQLNIMLRLKLKMHVVICQNCTNYKTQLDIIHKTAKNIPIIELANSEVQQINDSKENIIRQLNSNKK